MDKVRKITINYGKWLPLLALFIVLFAFFYFHLYSYFSFKVLHQHQQELFTWTNQHYMLAVFLYIVIYTITVAASIPTAIFFTILGGYLFDVWPGTLYVVICDTVGGAIFFVAVQIAIGDWVAKKAGKWLKELEKGFQENAFNYLLTLRLIPIFPSWLLNIVAALLGMRLSAFIAATFIGIIPSTIIYTSLGHSLGAIFAHNQMPNTNVIFQPQMFLPLLGLAVLALLPVIYKSYKK